MLKRTTREYDIHHSGTEVDRLELIGALAALADLVNGASLAGVEIDSVKSDLIMVKITEIEGTS